MRETITVSFPRPKLMSQQQIQNDGIKFHEPGPLSLAAVSIPIQFNVDVPLSYQIKIQPQNSMTHLTSEKPLIPALFQIAALADDLYAMPTLKGMLATGRMPLADTMLDADKLEEVLKAIARRKKSATRRILVSNS
jgi:hypothetical protein